MSTRRPPRGVIFHSDRGCQYTSAVITAQDATRFGEAAVVALWQSGAWDDPTT